MGSPFVRTSSYEARSKADCIDWMSRSLNSGRMSLAKLSCCAINSPCPCRAFASRSSRGSACARHGQGELMAQQLSFARDIRPLFRDLDIQSMQSAFDLASYEDVRTNGEPIYAVL